MKWLELTSLKEKTEPEDFDGRHRIGITKRKQSMKQTGFVTNFTDGNLVFQYVSNSIFPAEYVLRKTFEISIIDCKSYRMMISSTS